MGIEGAWHDVLRQQLGLVTRAQALEHGFTRSAIAWRLSRELWHRVLPSVYATFTGAPSAEQRLQAAALYAGVGAQITGTAALRYHGVRYVPKDERVQVLLPTPSRRKSRAFVLVTSTNRPDDHPRLRPALDICSPTRAGADAARLGYTLREVRAFLAEIVQRRMTTVAALAEESRLGPKRHSTLLRRVIEELADGARAAPEAELRDVVRTSLVLPRVRWNPRLTAADGTVLPTPDGWIEDAGIALESNSYEFHSEPRDWRRTYERHNVLASYGILTLHFTPRDVREDPDRVLARIEKAYSERAAGFTGVRAE